MLTATAIAPIRIFHGETYHLLPQQQAQIVEIWLDEDLETIEQTGMLGKTSFPDNTKFVERVRDTYMMVPREHAASNGDQQYFVKIGTRDSVEGMVWSRNILLIASIAMLFHISIVYSKAINEQNKASPM